MLSDSACSRTDWRCCGSRARLPSSAAPPPAATDEGDGPDTVIQELDRLWAETAGPDAVERAVTLARRRSVAQHPSSYLSNWRLARVYWRRGNLATDKSQRRETDVRHRTTLCRSRRQARPQARRRPLLLRADHRVRRHAQSVSARHGKGSERFSNDKRAYDIELVTSTMFDAGSRTVPTLHCQHDVKQSRRYLEELKQRHPEHALRAASFPETDKATMQRQGETQYVLSHDPVADRAVEQADITVIQRRMREWFARPPRRRRSCNS